MGWSFARIRFQHIEFASCSTEQFMKKAAGFATLD
jgi:hypothetical protein